MEYLTLIENEFMVRKDRNERYSLRAFGRDLGISCSHLSSVLNRRTTLSTDLACKIALKLNLSQEDFYKFVVAVYEDQNELHTKTKGQSFILSQEDSLGLPSTLES